MKKIVLFTAVACAISVAASAQETPTYTVRQTLSADQAPHISVAGTKLTMAFEAKAVPNAPYQGEATTESVMTLADGNRIVKRTVTRVYRDSAGRTRKETLGPDGQVTAVFISDPVGKSSYALDPSAMTASRTAVFYALSHVDGEPATTGTISHAIGASAGSGTVTVTQSSGAGTTEVHEVRKSIVVTASDGGAVKVDTSVGTKGDVTKEDLGEQTVEGVLAKGTRTTTTIPAGAVDNEQPIRIVSEEWYSSELQVLVLTKHSDPRVGDTVYRLTNISRTEPAKSLFELPAGYSIKIPDTGTGK